MRAEEQRAAAQAASDLSRQERRSALRTIKRVVPYVWPQDAAWVRRRVVLSMLTLVLGKLIAVVSPIYFKSAVDALAGDAPVSDGLPTR